MATRRNPSTRSYGPRVEFKFVHKNVHPQIADLEGACRQLYGVKDDEKIAIAKYFPHKFEWKWFNPDEEITEKKKNKEVKYKAANCDLKKMPFILKDGDIIGIRFESENLDGKDDWQTEEDQVKR